jgi:SAM-dependent methyltransferase
MATDFKPIPSEITRERWLRAQRWELQFWNRQNIPPPRWKRLLRPLLVLLGLRHPLRTIELDDRNYWWREKFDGYRMLPSAMTNVVELGCGPYTNIRLIRLGRRISSITCSDPLAAHYVRYPRAWLAQAIRQGSVAVDHHPIEDCPFASNFFELTIMINVLDHVRDAAKCVHQAVRITAPGGYLIVGQDLTGPSDSPPANPGHPFLLTDDQIVPILDAACDRVLHRIVPREEVSDPDMHYGALAYIGRKRP